MMSHIPCRQGPREGSFEEWAPYGEKVCGLIRAHTTDFDGLYSYWYTYVCEYHQRMTLMIPALVLLGWATYARIPPMDYFDDLYSYWYTYGHISVHTTYG